MTLDTGSANTNLTAQEIEKGITRCSPLKHKEKWVPGVSHDTLVRLPYIGTAL